MKLNGKTVLSWGLGGVSAAVLLYYFKQNGGENVVTGTLATVADTFTRGKRLTTTTLNAEGYIDDDPEELAAIAEANYDGDFLETLSIQSLASNRLDVYALARMARSEADPEHGAINRLIRMHVALNDYAALSWPSSLAALFLYSNNPAAKGHFGKQNGRRYSTATDPYAGDIALALKAIGDHANGIDPSLGATKFVDIAGLGGVQEGSASYQEVVDKWAKEGLIPRHIDGQPSGFVVFGRSA